MPFELKSKSENMITLVFKRIPKLAIKFSSSYSLVNAVNLAGLAQACYSDLKDNGDYREFVRRLNRKLLLKNKDASPSDFFPFYDNDISAEEFSFNESFFLDRGFSHQCLGYEDDQYLVVAFRGTREEVKDLITDGKTAMTPDFTGMGNVHIGFWGGLQALLGNTERSLEDADETGGVHQVTSFTVSGLN
jgi:hypothetical protein